MTDITLTAVIPSEIKRELKAAAAMDGITMREVVTEAIRYYLEKKKNSNQN